MRRGDILVRVTHYRLVPSRLSWAATSQVSAASVRT